MIHLSRDSMSAWRDTTCWQSADQCFALILCTLSISREPQKRVVIYTDLSIRTYSTPLLKKVSPTMTIPLRSYQPADERRASHQIELQPSSELATAKTWFRTAVPTPRPWYWGSHANLRKRADIGTESTLLRTSLGRSMGNGSLNTEMTAIGTSLFEDKNAP